MSEPVYVENVVCQRRACRESLANAAELVRDVVLDVLEPLVQSVERSPVAWQHRIDRQVLQLADRAEVVAQRIFLGVLAQ